MKRPYLEEPDVVRYTEEEIKEMIAHGESRTDWERVEKMRDEEITVDEDAPEITEEMMARAQVIRRSKEIVTIFGVDTLRYLLLNAASKTTQLLHMIQWLFEKTTAVKNS